MKLAVVAFVKGRETAGVKLKLENYLDGYFLEFLQRKEARVDAHSEANVFKFTIEHHQNHITPVFTYEEFHSVRPPELLCHSISCFQFWEKLIQGNETAEATKANGRRVERYF